MAFLAISDQYETFFSNNFYFFFIFDKMTAVDHISGHFRSIRNFIFFDKMATGAHFGCPKFTSDRISGNFRSIRNFYFLEIFDKMAAVGHFGYPKFTFDRISGHCRSILNFFFFGNFLQNGCRRPFWMSEIHFQLHFWPIQIDTQLFFLAIFDKMAAVGHFGCPKFTFDRISAHFRSIQNLDFFLIFLQNGHQRTFWMFENHFFLLHF